MNAKRFALLGLIGTVALVALLAVTAGTTYAQGPRGGGRGGNGAGSAGGGMGVNVPRTGMNAGTGINGTGNCLNGSCVNVPNNYGTGVNPGTGLNGTGTCLNGGTCVNVPNNYGTGMYAGGMGGRYGSQAGTSNYGMGMGVQSRLNTQLQDGTCCTNLPAASGELTAEAIDALTAGLADEVNAYTAYGQIIAQLGSVAPIVQIQQAEASHIAVLEAAFARYGVEVPSITASVDMNVSSLAEACAIGAEAEIANFGLYDQWIATVSDYPDLVQVFTALRNASEFSHLPAFQACAG